MSFNPLRHQLPVYSPLSLRVLLTGARGLFASRESLRRRVADRLRSTYSPRALLLTDSGTSALRLAIAPQTEQSGSRPVALPAYCCYDVATAADGAGVPVVLYDLDPETLAPDAASLEAALSFQPRAVVVVHLYGIPVAMEAMNRRLRDADALLVEDAAQGLNARYGEAPLGSFGSLSVLSFGRGKGLSGGGGGALLAHDEAGEARLDTARSRIGDDEDRGWGAFAASAAQWIFGRPALYGIPTALPFLSLGETTYEPPSDVCPATSVSLALISAAWELAREEAETRRRRARQLRSALARVGDVLPVRVPPGGEGGYLRLPVIARSPGAAERLDSAEARRRGVMPGYPRPLHRLAGFRPRIRNLEDGRDARFPGAETLSRKLFTLPVHSRLTEGDLTGLVSLVAGHRPESSGGRLTPRS